MTRSITYLSDKINWNKTKQNKKKFVFYSQSHFKGKMWRAAGGKYEAVDVDVWDWIVR